MMTQRSDSVFFPVMGTGECTAGTAVQYFRDFMMLIAGARRSRAGVQAATRAKERALPDGTDVRTEMEKKLASMPLCWKMGVSRAPYRWSSDKGKWVVDGE